MSVVITKNPSPFQPCKSDDLYFVVSADTTNNPKFRYVYNVYVEDYLVFQGKATPNPYGLGIIDVSMVLDSYLQNYPVAYHNTTPIFAHQTSVFSRPFSNEVVEYYIEVGEEYADSFIDPITGFTGLNTIGNPSVQSDTFKSFLGTMGVNGKANLQTFDIGQFTLSGNPTPNFPYTTTNLFLTNAPRIQNITPQEYYTLSFTNYELGGGYLSEPYFVRYKFFDVNGFEIISYDYANIKSNGGGPAMTCNQDYYDQYDVGSDFSILNVGVGPKNIANFPPNVDYYTVQLFGKAIAPSPTPTPSSTATPTPTPTIGVSPTPTPSITPSTSPIPPCNLYQFINTNFEPTTITWEDCSIGTLNYELQPNEDQTFCAISYSVPPGVNVNNLGLCDIPNPSASPTPTPTSTPQICVTGTTLNITKTGWIKYNNCDNELKYINVQSTGAFTITECHLCNTIAGGTPFSDIATFNAVVCGSSCGIPPAPTPTPSPVVPRNVIVRDCCTGTVDYQVIAAGELSVGNVIVIADFCYEIYSIGGDGSDGDYTTALSFINCNECKSQFPCPIDPNKPSIIKPDVQPGSWSPQVGSAPCVLSYVPVSEIFQFNMKPDCNYFLNRQIMFKNRYGAWDYFLFEKYRSEGLGIERENYGQFNNSWGSQNPIKTNYSRGTTDYNTNIVETHIVNSGFLNDPEFVWLEELYTTNDAYLIQPDGTLFPINIVGAEFVRKNKGNRSITNVELTYVYSNNIRLLNN